LRGGLPLQARGSWVPAAARAPRALRPLRGFGATVEGWSGRSGSLLWIGARVGVSAASLRRWRATSPRFSQEEVRFRYHHTTLTATGPVLQL